MYSSFRLIPLQCSSCLETDERLLELKTDSLVGPDTISGGRRQFQQHVRVLTKQCVGHALPNETKSDV